MVINERFKKIFLIVGLGLLCAGLMLAGCSERENPMDPDEVDLSAAEPVIQSMDFGASLAGFPLDPQDQRTSRIIRVYTPPEHEGRGQGPKYPVLYLLHDHGFDERQFDFYGLTRMAHEMILRGEIKPMIIVMVDASNIFGLGMYANSFMAGDYEDLIYPDLVTQIDEGRSFDSHVLGGSSARAIGGIGFGGQAAIKIAMKNPDIFGSVSAINAPLAFAGDGGTTSNGLQELFKFFFLENNIPPGDFDAYKAVRDNPDLDNKITSLIFAMSAAFSPTTDLQFLRPWTARFRVPGFNDTAYFELPFDHQTYLSTQVWERWLEEDVQTLYTMDEYRDNLNDIPVYIDAAENDEFGFFRQAELFAGDLAAGGHVNYTFEAYGDTQGLTADHTEMIRLRLREILLFHSEHLELPM